MKYFLLSVLVIFQLYSFAQATDKAEADLLIYHELTAGYETENWHPEMIVNERKLTPTEEEGIFVVKGDSFQVKSVRTDFYVTKKDEKWVTLNDSRFPMETLVNLLLNRIEKNSHLLKIRHHQYGGNKPLIEIPMQRLFDQLARNTQLYCSIMSITDSSIQAVLVFHQKRINFIHMLLLEIPSNQLFVDASTFTGDLYTNIPQSNIKSLFRERTK